MQGDGVARVSSGHLQRARVLSERALERHRLELVVERRRRAVRVDVAHRGGRQTRRLERAEQARRHALALGVRRGDVEGVAVGSVSRQLAVDLGAARLGVLLRLEQKHARALRATGG